MGIKSADQITLIDVTDAYSVMLTSEAYTFVGGTSGVGSGQSCSTEAVAFCGSSQCTVVSVNQADIVCPTGISASVTNSGTSKVKVTFTTTATISNACEASIPVVVDGITMNKKFSFAVAKTGATGATGSTGATGATGNGISTVTNYYLTTSASSGVTTSTTGWKTTPVATTTTNKYIWCYQKITYTDSTSSNTTPAIIGTHGATGATGATGSTGAAGQDAITISVTSSNGTVFKNNSGSTVLTAHVYKGGVEQSITDAGVCGSLGSIKWYKGGSTTAVATAKTLTVSASDVANSAVYTCQLEG